MTRPCSSCIHYRVTQGLHPVESWCNISGSLLRAEDVWRNNEKAHTSKFGVFTEDVPDCKFTMSPREVGEYDEWKASKITLYYRQNRGTYSSFTGDLSNQHWLDQKWDEEEVEMNNWERLWPVFDNGKLLPRVIKYDEATNKIIHDPLLMNLKLNG